MENIDNNPSQIPVNECGCILVHMSFVPLGQWGLGMKKGWCWRYDVIARLILQSALTKSLYFVCYKCTRMRTHTHTNFQNSPWPASYFPSAGVGDPLWDIPYMTAHYCDLVVLQLLSVFLLLVYFSLKNLQ